MTIMDQLQEVGTLIDHDQRARVWRGPSRARWGFTLALALGSAALAATGAYLLSENPDATVTTPDPQVVAAPEVTAPPLIGAPGALGQLTDLGASQSLQRNPFSGSRPNPDSIPAGAPWGPHATNGSGAPEGLEARGVGQGQLVTRQQPTKSADLGQDNSQGSGGSVDPQPGHTTAPAPAPVHVSFVDWISPTSTHAQFFVNDRPARVSIGATVYGVRFVSERSQGDNRCAVMKLVDAPDSDAKIVCPGNTVRLR